MMVGWAGRIVLPVWLATNHAFGESLQFCAWDGKGFRAAGAGDVHSDAVAIEINHGAAHGLAVAHDRVLDYAGEATAAFGEIAAHLVVAVGGNIEEFGFGGEADIDGGCFSVALEGDADFVASLVLIERIGELFDFCQRLVVDGDDDIACLEPCLMGSAFGSDLFEFEVLG